MSAATQNEMGRLRKERGEWKQQAEAEAIVAGSYRDERDAALEREQALAAHVERLTSELEDRSMTNDPKAASEHYWQCADEIEPHVSDGSLMASVVESFEFLLGFWLGAGKPNSLARLKAECWKEAYLAGMEHGHHLTVEGGYIPYDEEAAEDYVAERQAEGGGS